MLLTPQHRRSNRRRKPTQKVEKSSPATYDVSLQCDEEFASSETEKKVSELSPTIYSTLKNLKMTDAEITQNMSTEEGQLKLAGKVLEYVFDIYDECPDEEGYEYDKDYYLASSCYSSFVDEEIAALRMQKKK